MNTNTNAYAVRKHNNNLIKCAERYATEMRENPSYLEQKMQKLLDTNGINYQFQKILYMESTKGYIDNFYIADFYLPNKKIIIETDGKFHDKQQDYDNFRMEDIQSQFPQIAFIRWDNSDFSSEESIKQLFELII